MCLTEGISDTAAFAFLSDVSKKLMQEHDYKSLCGYNAYQLGEFTEILQQYMSYYNSTPKKSKTGEVIEELNAAKDVITENIEKLLERDMKLNIIVAKSENINTFSSNISNIVNLFKINYFI